MGIQADLKDALDGDRDDLIRTLAEHRVTPDVVEGSTESGLLDREPKPSFRLDAHSDETGSVDRQTTALVADALGLESEADCDAVCQEIESHSAWE